MCARSPSASAQGWCLRSPAPTPLPRHPHLCAGRPEVLDSDLTHPARQDHGPLDDVAHFADVSRHAADRRPIQRLGAGGPGQPGIWGASLRHNAGEQRQPVVARPSRTAGSPRAVTLRRPYRSRESDRRAPRPSGPVRGGDERTSTVMSRVPPARRNVLRLEDVQPSWAAAPAPGRNFVKKDRSPVGPARTDLSDAPSRREAPFRARTAPTRGMCREDRRSGTSTEGTARVRGQMMDHPGQQPSLSRSRP